MTDPTPRAARPAPGPRTTAANGRKRRPHPAARARIIAAGLAGTAAFGMVAGMALPHAGVAAAPAAPSAATASTPTDSRAATSTPVPVPAPSLAPAPVTSSSGS